MYFYVVFPSITGILHGLKKQRNKRLNIVMMFSFAPVIFLLWNVVILAARSLNVIGLDNDELDNDKHMVTPMWYSIDVTYVWWLPSKQ